MQRRVEVLTIVIVVMIIVLASLIFLVACTPVAGSNNSSATATVQQKNTKPTATAPTQFSRLDTNPQRLTLTNVDYNGLLNNAQTAVDAVKQQIRSQIPQGQNVGLAIVYDGTPDVNGISVADNVTEKVYSVLQQLGQEGFVFSHASYYVPLYTLGPDHSLVTIDVFYFAKSQQSTPTFTRLAPSYKTFTFSNVDYNGILSDSQSAMNNFKQQIRSQMPTGQEAGLVIVYAGAPTEADIGQADTIDAKVYSILQQLGQEGFAFKYASYYDKNPLFTLGTNPSVVKIDIFFLVQ